MATKLNPNAIIDSTITPSKLAPSVMQHLEAITIYTGNTAEHKAANLANIKAYEDNLKAMGVDVTREHLMPVSGVLRGSNIYGVLTGKQSTSGARFNGIVSYANDNSYVILINEGGIVFDNEIVCVKSQYTSLTTTAKQVIPAINEVNAKIGDIDTILDNIIG